MAERGPKGVRNKGKKGEEREEKGKAKKGESWPAIQSNSRREGYIQFTESLRNVTLPGQELVLYLPR